MQQEWDIFADYSSEGNILFGGHSTKSDSSTLFREKQCPNCILVPSPRMAVRQTGAVKNSIACLVEALGSCEASDEHPAHSVLYLHPSPFQHSKQRLVIHPIAVYTNNIFPNVNIIRRPQ